MLLAGILSCALIAALFLFNGQSPRSIAGDFMSALCKGDADTVAGLSYVPGKSKEQLRKEWADAMGDGKAYLFSWDIQGVDLATNDSAVVNLKITTNPNDPEQEPEARPLTLIKDKGAWKVDLSQLSREAFPYLPR